MCFEKKNYDPIELRGSLFCLWDKITVKYSREKTTNSALAFQEETTRSSKTFPNR